MKQARNQRFIGSLMAFKDTYTPHSGIQFSYVFNQQLFKRTFLVSGALGIHVVFRCFRMAFGLKILHLY